MTEKSITVYKRFGETPLECVGRLRAWNPKYTYATLGYAGRLDPMAEGVLVILVNDENKQREEYLSLSKEYVVDILFGFESDTYDILGLVANTKNTAFASADALVQMAREKIALFVGVREQEYPPFSSKPVQGIPLFQWAREGKISSITIPCRKIEIYFCEFLGSRQILREACRRRIMYAFSLVTGDFRQKDIKERWSEVLGNTEDVSFPVVKMRLGCSSGTYVRSIAHELGKMLGIGALALRIVRTKVGTARLRDALRL